MCSLVELIRISMIHNDVRNYAIMDIKRQLGITRHGAKRLVFAWMYRATDEYLQDILVEEKSKCSN